MTPYLWWLLRSLLFLVIAVPVCAYALTRGGWPERLTAATIVAAVIATTLIPEQTYASVVLPLLVIDVGVLIVMVMIAQYADRFWPMYFAAVQLLTVWLHGVRAYDPAILPDVYARLAGQLAYPTLLLLAVGTWRHVRRGPERDWSWQVGRDRDPATVTIPTRD